MKRSVITLGLACSLGAAALASIAPVRASTVTDPLPPPVPNAIAAPLAANPAVVVPPLPALDNDAARREAARLTGLMRTDIPFFTMFTPAARDRWLALAHQQVEQTNTIIDRAQIVMVVDRNPLVQRVCFVLALPNGDWSVIGGTRVSTGQSGRKYYYITPTGVFENGVDRLGYRAEGTKNENGIRGIGAKGMRVWDMGWQWATKGWLPSHEKGEIRLEIHATDPDFLESRLGRPASEGCIRVPAKLNVFMDHYGILDAEYEQAASYDIRFRALLPKNRQPTSIAGDLVVVVDSSTDKTV